MSKELGENLSQNFIRKVACRMFMTYHSQDRIKERCPELVGENLQKTMENVNKAIMGCKFAYNNNDGSISIILQNDCTLILTFNDDYKKWHIVTVKEQSRNGFTPYQKSQLAKMYTYKNRYKHDFSKMTEYSKEKNRKAKPYKRDNRWKGEKYGY